MRILFFGGGDWAPATLSCLVDAGHKVDVVPACEDSAQVSAQADRWGLHRHPPGTRAPADLAEPAPDLLVSVDFDRILTRDLLALPRLGGINAHPGMLPRYRGVGVVTWAVQNGEPEVGITVHHMDEGIDSGDIILQRAVPVGLDDRNAEIIERIRDVLPRLVVDAVRLLEAGNATRTPQNHRHATYFPRRRARDNTIDWAWPSRRVHDLVRALSAPNPGARASLDGQPLIIWRTRLRPDAAAYRGPVGQVVGHEEGLPVVKTGDSTITVVEVQRAGLAEPVHAPAWRLGTSMDAPARGGYHPPPEASPDRGPAPARLASRVASLPTYLFAGIDQQIAAARAAGLDPISLSSGTPDLPTPEFIVAELARASTDPSTHRYPDFYGLPAFRAAVAAYYRRRFGVDLDPDTEVLPLIGTKEGIAHLPWVVVDPADAVGVPDPGYPVYEASTRLAGGQPVPVTLRREQGWFPDFDEVAARRRELGRPLRMFWLNYPNNPTAAVATVDQLATAVRFAAEQGALLAYDNAYSEITFDGYLAPSVLQVPGARDVAVEFGSLSKTYSMAGWRVGWMVGNPVVVEALGRLKTNIDSGIFTAVQWAAVAALERGDAAVPALTGVYRRRRDVLLALFHELGWPVDPPKGSMYLWLATPPGESSRAFAERLLHHARVVVTPGVGYGPAGEGHVRLGLAVPDSQLAEAGARLRAAFGGG